MSLVWQVRLAHQAEVDVVAAMKWTTENFGRRQAELYAQTVTLAMEALHEGPTALDCKARDDIGPNIRTLHVARQGPKGRHFVVFKEAAGQVIDVLRLLHDSMDLARHVLAANDRRII